MNTSSVVGAIAVRGVDSIALADSAVALRDSAGEYGHSAVFESMAAADAFNAYKPFDARTLTKRDAAAQTSNAANSGASPATESTKPDRGHAMVGRDDALWTIAGNYDVPGATRYQKMVAILTANPHAFVDNDINRLKLGARLSLPDAATVLAVNAAEAQRLCADQINTYEQKRRGTTPVASRPDKTAAAELKGGDSVVVTFGQTLGGIAQKYQVPDATLPQKIVAIFNANPDAFAGNNMNRMKTGVRLAMPDANAVRGVGADVAQRIVKAQWETYQRSRA